MDNDTTDNNIVSFPDDRVSESEDKDNNEQTTHEVLSQDPYYKFIHDLLFAIDSIGLPLDKDPKEKARELFAKYQRENLIAQWQKDLEDEYIAKQNGKSNDENQPSLSIVEDSSSLHNDDKPKLDL